MSRPLPDKLCLTLLAAVALMLGGCVHEWPEPPSSRKAILRVHHEHPWDLLEWNGPARSRTHDPSDMTARYIFAVYHAGATKEPPVKRTVAYRPDIEREDFDIELELKPGSWDIRVWSDNVDADSSEPIFYNADDFGAITYQAPYEGAERYKDAFAGTITIDVPDMIEADWKECTRDLTLRRPLTAFAFIATDLKEFTEQEYTRTRENAPAMSPDSPDKIPPLSLDDYTAKVSYAGYVPSVYHHFTDRPVDSATGISFTTGVTGLNETEALTGFDHIFINGSESTVRVALDFYHRDGTHIGRVASFDIPLKRNRCTVVRGEFLTSKATGTTGIDPAFEGEFNIEYK